MGIFSGRKTYEHDARITVVDRAADIPRCGQWFRRAHGILCHHPIFTPEEKQEIANFMKERLPQERAVFADNYRGFKRKDIPAVLYEGFEELSDIFHRATGTKDCRILMRANSSHPTTPHAHDVTMTYTFLGEGTVGVNAKGEMYSVPQDHIFLFDRIPHMASQTFSEDRLKLTILAG